MINSLGHVCTFLGSACGLEGPQALQHGPVPLRPLPVTRPEMESTDLRQFAGLVQIIL